MNEFSNALELIRRGGVIMIPLLFCSVVSVTIMIERAVALRRASSDTSSLMNTLHQRLEKDDVSGALSACETVSGPIPRMLASGLRRLSSGPAAVERQMEEQALAESPELHRRLSWLDTIITISPLLGLLGTIVGMISSFRVLGSTGVSHPAAITSGVAEALIATATGLVIAIVTLVGYNALNHQADEVLNTMELRATQLLDFLAGQRERSEAADRVGERTREDPATDAKEGANRDRADDRHHAVPAHLLHDGVAGDDDDDEHEGEPSPRREREKMTNARVLLTMTDRGQVYMNAKVVPMDAVTAQLHNRIAANPETVVIINADERLRHGQVIALMDAAKLAGPKYMQIATQPNTNFRK